MERSTHTLAVKSQKWLAEALLCLIQQKHYNDITISELCKKAGLDRRTFYRNFKDKNDVLMFYFSTLQEDYLSMLKSVREHTFFTLANAYFSFWACHLDFLKTAQVDQTLFTIMFSIMNEFIPSTYGGVQGDISTELKYNILFTVGGFHNVLLRWISCGFKETPEQLSATLSVMFNKTISYWPLSND